jgi:hypothetical protein
MKVEVAPNTSLILTEGAVDNFAARCGTDVGALTGTSVEPTTWWRLIAAATYLSLCS